MTPRQRQAPPAGGSGSTDADDGADDRRAPWQWRVDVPLLGPVGWPPTGSAAFLVVVGGLAVVEVVSWPLAVAVGIGHVLARDHDNRMLREIGEGLQVA
ncbi:hypothetical protein LQ327_20980 [Actinomycetospora endophytica]|uniref:Uncharacterized protein n=1 Tax=Actinomycetospora endophytica TaxID=2291215 RepID=A0ABS8PFR1_9PSEU|nr:hypothetical protein [Actinomycetospora endophytica]MCD2195849.1 hypothetical protein [Actinomycetospora endophytica]